MTKFKRLPLEVEAMQVKTPFIEVAEWCGGELFREGPAYQGIDIQISDGSGVTAMKGEWIVKFPDGHLAIYDEANFNQEFKEIE